MALGVGVRLVAVYATPILRSSHFKEEVRQSFVGIPWGVHIAG